MENVVKIITDDDGEKINDNSWHYVFEQGGDRRTFCSGMVFGIGESISKYKEKEGKITCRQCISFIKIIKAVKL